ncbi:hypothetical protein ACQRWP_16845 [Micromonospora trifolii]|uniref:hypothetical protein n=1 Tax=Micromonospora trifolii TaxID=2911208 RepID=UPI003D2ECAFD
MICCGVCGRIMNSHWVHDRAGYRCRHGNTSARPTSSRRQKTLYVREDHLLDRIRHDSCLRRRHPAMRDQDPDSVAGYLRLNNMITVCDHDHRTIEADTAVFPLTAPTSVLTRTARSPPNAHTVGPGPIERRRLLRRTAGHSAGNRTPHRL